MSSGIVAAELFGVGSGGDDAARLLACLEFASGRRIQVGGDTTVKLETIMSFDGPVDLEFLPGSVVDTGPNSGLHFSAEPTVLPELAADIAPTDHIIRFMSESGLKPDDVWGVWNPNPYSWSLHRDYYRAGAMYRVAENLGLNPNSGFYEVRIYGLADYAATATDFECWRLGGRKCHVRGMKLSAPTVEIPLFIDGYSDVLLDDYDIALGSPHSTNIEFFRCFGVRIGRGRSLIGSSDAYPIVLSNSYNVVIEAATDLYSDRHCVGIGGRGGELSVPCTNIQFMGGILDNDQVNDIGSIDTHGNVRRVAFNNMIVRSANIAGQDITLNNCIVEGRKLDGNAVAGSEYRGGYIDFNNCRFVCRGGGASFGACDHFLKNLSAPLTFNYRNCVWELREGGSDVRLIKFSTPDGDVPDHSIQLNVFNPVVEGASMFSLFGISSDVTLTSRLKIEVFGEVSAPFGALVASSVVANNGCVVRYPQPRDRVGVWGDESTMSPLNPMVNARTQIWSSTLTAARSVDFETSTAYVANGTRFRIVRSADGAFALNVGPGPLKALEAGQWGEVTFLNGAWVLTQFGSL